MTKEQLCKIIGYQPCYMEYAEDISSLYNGNSDTLWLMTKAFAYGVIIGKRKARKKKDNPYSLASTELS